MQLLKTGTVSHMQELDISGLCITCCIDSLSAVSHSAVLFFGAGGYLAASYALRHPEQVQHLVLVGPAGIVSVAD
jgi:hypothetical protein